MGPSTSISVYELSIPRVTSILDYLTNQNMLSPMKTNVTEALGISNSDPTPPCSPWHPSIDHRPLAAGIATLDRRPALRPKEAAVGISGAGTAQGQRQGTWGEFEGMDGGILYYYGVASCTSLDG